MNGKEYSNINTARRAAVSKAWEKERTLVMEGKGSRDWSRSQQAEIVSTGKCNGYVGHHKCSVSKNPKEAGNVDNIQFLTVKEHIEAHSGNYKNDPHGRYDPVAGSITKYNDNIEPEPILDLSKKMAESRKQSSINKYGSLQENKADYIKVNASRCAKNYQKRYVKKETSIMNRHKTSIALCASKTNATMTRNGINTKKGNILSDPKIVPSKEKSSVALGNKASLEKKNGRVILSKNDAFISTAGPNKRGESGNVGNRSEVKSHGKY